MTDITDTDDIIDVRDVIERVEELREARDEMGEPDAWAATDEAEELARLEALLDELRGNGGNHQWEGDWFPVTLVRDSYFESFARDEAEQLGLIKSDAAWPANCIDWEKAAEQLQQDYTMVDFGESTYWYR